MAIAEGFVPPAYGYPPEMRAVLPALWARMLAAGQLNSGVVEDPSLPQGQRVCGVGLSVFVTDAFGDAALAAPRPDANAWLHEMILAGNSPVLDRRAVAAANAGDGLALMPLHFATPSVDTRDPTVLRRLGAGQELFELCHAGYRVARVVKQVVDLDLCRFMISTGMRLHTDFSANGRECAKPAAERSYLLVIDRAELRPGSIAARAFIPGAARFRFSPAEQRVLFSALLHETDEDVAAELGVSPDTLRTHWRSIYGRVASVDPLFFEAREGNGDCRGRGKRRRLLRHVRTRMEELRPWAAGP